MIVPAESTDALRSLGISSTVTVNLLDTIDDLRQQVEAKDMMIDIKDALLDRQRLALEAFGRCLCRPDDNLLTALQLAKAAGITWPEEPAL